MIIHVIIINIKIFLGDKTMNKKNQPTTTEKIDAEKKPTEKIALTLDTMRKNLAVSNVYTMKNIYTTDTTYPRVTIIIKKIDDKQIYATCKNVVFFVPCTDFSKCDFIAQNKCLLPVLSVRANKKHFEKYPFDAQTCADLKIDYTV